MTSLKERFELLEPFLIGSWRVKFLVLSLVLSTAASVALLTHHKPPQPGQAWRMLTLLPPGQVPLDFLYNIPRGELDPTAGDGFASHWGYLARSMARFPHHPWAGKYVRGRDALLVSPAGQYAAVLTQAEHPLAKSYPTGTLRAGSDRITLLGRDATHSALLPDTLYPVHRGMRHYLLTDDELRREAKALQRDGKPDEATLEQAFIRAGDQNAPAAGPLLLPAAGVAG